MLIRIVKMSFYPDKIEDFLGNFDENKTQIRTYPGCLRLELYRDKNATNVFFTYSFWESEKDLEDYRQSELFKNVWAKTKILFDEKPKAWSLDKIVSLD